MSLLRDIEPARMGRVCEAMNNPGQNDPKRRDSEAAAKKWSRENERQSPPMDEQEQRSVQQSRAKAGADHRRGAPESAESKQTFPKREQRPGEAGLANEARPGLGTRADENDPAENPSRSRAQDDGMEPPKANPKAHRQPRPEPREQAPDTMAHEMERSTGVSGRTSGS